jgi:hypothetical protein
MAKKKIKVLVVPVGQSPEAREIEPALRPMQELVGGFIEAVYLEDYVQLICNEEGKLKGLPPNRSLPEIRDVVMGDFFVSRVNAEGESVSLTQKDIDKYTARFQEVL